MDERFADLLTNPKFRGIRKQDRKVKVDERFQSLIKSTKSRSQCRIDKRGRPLQASKNDLHQFYDLSDLEDEKDKKVAGEKRMTKTKREENNKKKVNRNKNSSVVEKSEEETDESEEDGIGHEDDESKEEEDDESEEDESEDDESEEDKNEVDKSEDEEEDEEDESEEDKSDDDKSKENEVRSRKEGSKVKKNKKKKKERMPDYSRGIGNESSSEEDEEQRSGSDDPEIEDDITKGNLDLAATIHPWADQTEREIPTVEESSRRLAICNMNWDYISAQDLMLLCNSFKPQHGTVISVTIYPTDFGLERMKGETMKGPKELVESEEQTTKNSLQTKNKKNKAMDAEQLRQYELNRLRYFVAVVECDSVDTADHIYRSCDGMEFEKTGTKLDFRYIPDDVTFDHEPKSTTSSLPASGTYKPPRFVDSALSKTDVKLSWDKTSHRRLAITQVDLRKVKNVDEMEEQMKEYLAPYTSEEEEEDDDNKKDEGADPYAGLDWSYVPEYIPEKKDVDELKKLLLEPEVNEAKDEDDIDMEITWEIGLKDNLEEAAKEKQKQMKLGKMTPFEQYKQKRKEKQRLKEREKRQSKRKNEKEERNTVGDGMDLETFFIGDDDDEQSDIRKESSSGKTKEQNNSNKIKSKDSLKKRAKKRKQELAEQRLEVDKAIMSDPRFADLASKDFAIDPSAPEFHKRKRKL